jgi:hypothetical protein
MNTVDNVDIDNLLSLIQVGQSILVQDRYFSESYQKWSVSATPSITNDTTNYWTIPVTFATALGTASTNFSNEQDLLVAIFSFSGTSGQDGTSGTSGQNGTSGISGVSGTSGTSGVSGINGIDGSSGTSGITGTSGTSGLSVGWTQSFITSGTTIDTATWKDITGATLTLDAGTYLLMATIQGRSATNNLLILMNCAIRDGSNNELAYGSTIGAAGSQIGWAQVNINLVVTHSVSTTYKLSGAKGFATPTNNWIASDGIGYNSASNGLVDTNEATCLVALKIS